MKPVSFQHFQMEFVLPPLPAYLISIILYQEDWIYLAGGIGSDKKTKSSYYKVNMMTGEVKSLRDLRQRCRHGTIVPTFTALG